MDLTRIWLLTNSTRNQQRESITLKCKPLFALHTSNRAIRTWSFASFVPVIRFSNITETKNVWNKILLPNLFQWYNFNWGLSSAIYTHWKCAKSEEDKLCFNYSWDKQTHPHFMIDLLFTTILWHISHQ